MRSLFNGFFEGKTVLITGHTGFIGSWLAIWLRELGASVIGYALPPNTDKDNYVISNLEQKMKSIIGDVRNFQKVNEVFEKYEPEIIFHLAAQPLVRKSYKIPKETFDINIRGTINIFEAFRLTKKSKVLINITSDKCYENQESLEGYCEEDKLGGHDPYSSSKACSELITQAYKNSFFNEKSTKNLKVVSSARSGNIIGGGDWQKDRLIPDSIKAIQNDNDIIIRNPGAIRPWQFVLEPLRGFLKLAKCMWEYGSEFSGAWNFGPGRQNLISVEDIVKKIIKFIKKGSYKIQSNENSNQLHETKILVLNSDKAKKVLKWSTILNIDETIEFICKWYFEKKLNYQFNVNQIKKYLEKLDKIKN